MSISQPKIKPHSDVGYRAERRFGILQVIKSYLLPIESNSVYLYLALCFWQKLYNTPRRLNITRKLNSFDLVMKKLLRSKLSASRRGLS